MRIVFLTRKKVQKYTDVIYRLNDLAVKNGDFELFFDGMDLMEDVCGLAGLNLAAEKVHEEIMKILEEIMKILEEMSDGSSRNGRTERES